MILKRTPKSSSRRNIFAGIAVIFLFLFVSFSYYAYQIVNTPNVEIKDEPVFVLIPYGATYEQAMDSIESKKVIIDKLSFRLMAKLMDYPELVKPGRYEMVDGYTNMHLLRKLRSGDQDPLKLTFNNIRLKDQLAEILASQVAASPAEIDSLLRDSAYVKALGFDTTTVFTMFIPNTYEIYWTVSADELLQRMKKEYEVFWNESRLEKAEKLDLTPVQVSTLASIVQAETIKNDEKPRVAGVYLNRLEKGMLLQADPTVIFAIGDFTIRRVLKVHLDYDSPYNTYKYKGLPPGPINLPNISSIDAVLNPEDHKYIFFCAKEDFSGYHNFAVTEREHINNARRYQRALNERNIMK